MTFYSRVEFDSPSPPCRQIGSQRVVNVLLYYDTHLHPSVDLVDWPAAGVDHLATSAVELPPELRVAVVHVSGQRVATIQLYVVYVPGCERCCVW